MPVPTARPAGPSSHKPNPPLGLRSLIAFAGLLSLSAAACLAGGTSGADAGPTGPDGLPLPMPMPVGPGVPDAGPGPVGPDPDGGPDGFRLPDGGILPARCAPAPRLEVLGPGSVVPGAPDRLLLRGRVVTPDTVLDPGEVLVEGTTLACVAADCGASPAAQGATVIDTRGVIFPGLVDAHNHTQYNYLPPWRPPGLFENRGQWAAHDDYQAHVATVSDFEDAFICQQVKYGELRALVGGTTTVQGTAGIGRRCFRTLVHNAEYADLDTDRMRTYVGGVRDVSAEDAARIAQQMADGSVTAYVIHLAEGTDELSRSELDVLISKGLLAPQTVIIHGTALGRPELEQVAAAGAKLVWSPTSNLTLYGATTDVPTALGLGIPVALAPDWTPSGSPSLLHELKRAEQHDCEAWGGTLSTRTLVEMVTSTAADVLALGAHIGRLAPGLHADLLVIADRGGDPYRTLIDARLEDVRLVVIDGSVRYGDEELRAASARMACEPLAMCGSSKFLCVPDNSDGTDQLHESYADIYAAIASFYGTPYSLEVCEPPSF